MPDTVRKYFAEFVGTAALILVGCGSVAIGGFGTSFPLGILPVAIAFGLVVSALAYGIGPISGCHINPAVTIANWIAGRMDGKHVPGYIIAQLLGGIAGAGLLALMLSGRISGYDIATAGLGQNGWGPGYLGAYSAGAAFLTEVIGTFLFMIVILGVTSKSGATPFAGLAVGGMLVVLIITFVNITGVSLNPARSLAPALFVGGHALAQVWLFFAAPTLGGAFAGMLFRPGVLMD